MHRVLFDYRIKAGKIFAGHYDIDLCCGANALFLVTVLTAYETKANLDYENGLDPFKQLRAQSDPKPAFNDKEFMAWFTNLVKELGSG